MPPQKTLTLLVLFLSVFTFLAAAEPTASTPPDAVTYERFGAVGDGVADDLPAIVAAHAYANEKGLPVRTRPDATYHLGTRALTAIIQTDTDWNTSRFIIDDSRGVENHKLPLFEVRSRLGPEALSIERLSRDQAHLDARPAQNLLVLVKNDERRIFIRRGLNKNSGTSQRDVFILRRDGTIEGGIDWDYDRITSVEALPIDPEPLVLKGGVFAQIANQMRQEVGYNYWSRNISIKRSNTEVRGLVLELSGEGEFGHPYRGFLRVEQAANVTFRDCRIPGRKTYTTIGAAGRPVRMGSYGYHAELVVNFRMVGCTMENIHDTTRWGVLATNFMKNLLIEDCVLSRVDVHQGVSGGYVIRRSTLGHQGVLAVGRGLLLIEDSTIHSQNLISFRGDYGSPWDGEVLVRRSRWAPPQGAKERPVMFAAWNDGTHDFGYPCSMPKVIHIEGLQVDDAWTSETETPGVYFFGNPLGEHQNERPFPYGLTERLEVRDLQTASGVFPSLSPSPELTQAIKLIQN